MTVLQMPLIPEQGVVRRVVPHAFAAEIRFGPGHPVIRAAPDAVRQDFLRRQVSRGQHELVPRAGQRRNPRPFRAEKRRRIHAVFQANQDLRLHHHQQPRIGIHEYRIHRHIRYSPQARHVRRGSHGCGFPAGNLHRRECRRVAQDKHLMALSPRGFRCIAPDGRRRLHGGDALRLLARRVPVNHHPVHTASQRPHPPRRGIGIPGVHALQPLPQLADPRRPGRPGGRCCERFRPLWLRKGRIRPPQDQPHPQHRHPANGPSHKRYSLQPPAYSPQPRVSHPVFEGMQKGEEHHSRRSRPRRRAGPATTNGGSPRSRPARESMPAPFACPRGRSRQTSATACRAP